MATVQGNTLGPAAEKLTAAAGRKYDFFTTAMENQSRAWIHVLQGDSRRAAENISLGSFVFDRIQPAPKGVPQLEVTIDLDASSALTILVKEQATGRTETRQLSYTTPARTSRKKGRQSLGDQKLDFGDEILDIVPANPIKPPLELTNPTPTSKTPK